ncbi:MAG: allophanate hydrolase subunit 1 [Acidimicrobiales bacterium]
MTTPTFTAIADHALLVEFATEISDRASHSVVALDRALEDQPPAGLLEVVPAFVNLLIDFDPLATDHDALTHAVLALLANEDAHTTEPTVHRVPICYDPSLALDLSTVAAATGRSTEAVIEAHLAGEYRVAMYGFAPGYAYMAGVPEPIQVPRKQAAVRGIAAGSVIIAGPQCLITTLDMPTGWSVIGRSPTRVLRPDHADPFLFAPGDRVVFERVDLASYNRLEAAAIGTASHTS